jgi:hypothetical protein
LSRRGPVFEAKPTLALRPGSTSAMSQSPPFFRFIAKNAGPGDRQNRKKRYA